MAPLPPTPTTATSPRLTPTLLFLLVTATLGPLLFGYHLAELNAPSQVIRCLPNIGNWDNTIVYNFLTDQEALPRCIPMTATEFGVVTSFFTLGGLVGALGAGRVTARRGRVGAMLVSAGLATVGALVEAVGSNVGLLAAGRFVSGLAAGGAMVVVPIYIFDIAPPGRKGFFGSFTQVMVNVGILITQVLGFFLSQEEWQLWRVILASAGAISLVQLVFLLCGGQESPKFLADRGKVVQAKKVLRKIRGENVDLDEEIAAWGSSLPRGLDAADEEAETLLANEESTHGDTGSRRPLSPNASKPTKPATLGALAVLRDPHTRPAVLTIVMIMLAQQFTGINSIIMYGVSLLSDLLAANSALLNILVSALNIIVTAAAAPLVERLGRKTCLLSSIAGMGLSSLALAFGIKNSVPILSALAVIVFVSSFGLGLGPIPFILPSEFVHANAVDATQSWALAANWIATFVVAQSFPILNEALGKGEVYFIFAAMAVAFGGFVGVWVPESRGRSGPDEVWGRVRRVE